MCSFVAMNIECALISGNYTALIADFGLSRFPETSFKWTAPEVLLETKPFSSKTDVYAFGCVLYEIFNLNAEDPFSSFDLQALKQAFQEKRSMEDMLHTNVLDIGFQPLLLRCLDTKIKKRPSFEEIDKIFQSIRETEDASESLTTSSSGQSQHLENLLSPPSNFEYTEGNSKETSQIEEKTTDKVSGRGGQKISENLSANTTVYQNFNESVSTNNGSKTVYLNFEPTDPNAPHPSQSESESISN
jgi:hypothetical protein